MQQTLAKLTVAYMQKVWQSVALSCAPPLLLAPTLPLSPWAVRDSPALSSLVFVSPSRAALGHLSVIVRPLKTVAMPTSNSVSLEAEQPSDTHECGCLAEKCLPGQGVGNGQLSPAHKGAGCGSPAPHQGLGNCPVGDCQLQCQLVHIPALLHVSKWKVGGGGQGNVVMAMHTSSAAACLQVVGPHRVVLCSRRAAEVEQQELAGGGSRDLRRLLQAGAADTCDATEPMSPDPLWPHPLGGLSAVHPAHGWSHITLPGA